MVPNSACCPLHVLAAPPDATCAAWPWLCQAWISRAIPGSPLVASLPLPQLGALPSQTLRPSFALYPGHHEPKLPSRGIHLEPNHGKGQHPSRPVAPRGAVGSGLAGPPALGLLFAALCLLWGWPRPPRPALLPSSSFTSLFSVVGPASSAPNSDK